MNENKTIGNSKIIPILRKKESYEPLLRLQQELINLEKNIQKSKDKKNE